MIKVGDKEEQRKWHKMKLESQARSYLDKILTVTQITLDFVLERTKV